MPLAFVLDENLRGGAIWHATQQYNANGVDVLDITRVGDPADLPVGTNDPDLLKWTERADRILVSLDKRTLPMHLAAHLQTGGHSPGVLILRPGSSNVQILFTLILIAHAGDPINYRDRIEFIP